MKKSRFTDSEIMYALKRAEAGIKVPYLCRRSDWFGHWSKSSAGAGNQRSSGAITGPRMSAVLYKHEPPNTGSESNTFS